MDRRVPTFYKIDKKQRMVISTASGELTFAEILAHQRDLSKDKDFDPTFAHIANLTDASLANISAEEMREFAQRSIFSQDARRAMVFPNLADYGLGRMYEMLRDLKGQTRVRAFRTFAEALEWVQAELSDEST